MRAARSMPPGWSLDPASDDGTRRMVVALKRGPRRPWQRGRSGRAEGSQDSAYGSTAAELPWGRVRNLRAFWNGFRTRSDLARFQNLHVAAASARENGF